MGGICTKKSQSKNDTPIDTSIYNNEVFEKMVIDFYELSHNELFKMTVTFMGEKIYICNISNLNKPTFNFYDRFQTYDFINYRDKAKEIYDNEECCICLDESSPPDCSLKCNHHFHQQCLTKMVQNKEKKHFEIQTETTEYDSDGDSNEYIFTEIDYSRGNKQCPLCRRIYY